MTIIRHLIRFFVSAMVLLLVAAVVPGFAIAGIGTAFLAALVIAGLGWVIEALFGQDISPYARGIVGFLVGAAVLYLTQFFVPGFRISLFGALFAALLIGLIDLFVPTLTRRRKAH